MQRFRKSPVAGRRAAERGRPQVAADLLGTALQAWPDARSPDVDGVALWPEWLELEDERRVVRHDRLVALVDSGRSDEAVAELRTAVGRCTTDKGLVALLMRALTVGGRPAEALDAYEMLQGVLAEG